MPHMYKAQPRRTSERRNHGMRQAIQAGMPGGERLIHRVSGGEVLRVILPAIPGDVPPLRFPPVYPPDARTLSPAELLHREARNILFRKAHLVHLLGDLQMCARIAHQLCLPHQQPGAVRQRPPAGVVADALFADPDGCHSAVSDQLHPAVRDARPRPEQQHADRSRRHMHCAALFRDGDRAVQPADRAPLQVQKGHAVADLRKRLQIRPLHAGDPRLAHTPWLRMTVSSPMP